ncbi:MAG: hypothetical protein DRQ43_05175 [Gammaproteobacteria bacterium]|nr:MAG: hypothetical protein DRQ43_05175 [Gammaproteobacteria bacterium]
MSQTRFSSSKKLTIIWVILIALTLSTAYIGYLELSGLYIVAFLLLTVTVKGQLIIDHYIGLKDVRGFWRLAMLGFVYVIPGIILTGYYLSSV